MNSLIPKFLIKAKSRHEVMPGTISSTETSVAGNNVSGCRRTRNNVCPHPILWLKWIGVVTEKRSETIESVYISAFFSICECLLFDLLAIFRCYWNLSSYFPSGDTHRTHNTPFLITPQSYLLLTRLPLFRHTVNPALISFPHPPTHVSSISWLVIVWRKGR